MTSALQMLVVVAMVMAVGAQELPPAPPMPPQETTTTAEPKVYPSTYWFTFPRKVRPGLALSVRGEILKATQPVTVTFALVNVTSNLAQLTFPTHTFQPNVPETVELQIPTDLPDPQWRGYRLNLTATGGLEFKDSHVVNFDRKARSIFVQTDKAMYKPGDTVNFRVLVMRPDLSVAKVPMDILIMDPNNNRIAQWLGVQDPSGVYQGSMATASEPVLGDWSMKVTVEGQEETQTFTIAEYVLPKFEAKLDLPGYGVSSDPSFSGKVKVKYTFGKPVEGTARIAMQVKYYYNRWRGQPAPEITRYIQVSSGEGDFSFTRGEILRLARDSSYNTSRPISDMNINYMSFIFIANVTETITGKKMNAEGEVIFYDNPYNLEFVGRANVFKPGMTFRAMVKVSKRDGSALESTTGVQVNVTMTYDVRRPTTTAPPTTTTTTPTPDLVLDPKNASVNRLDPIEVPVDIGYPFYWPQYDTLTLSTQLYDVSADGYVPLTMEVPTEAERINIHAEALEAASSLYAGRSYSLSENYIQLSLPANRPKPKVGETAIFTVRGTEDISSLTYEVISKGRLVESQTVRYPSPARTVELSVPVQGEMAPSSSIVVYYRRADGEIVADSNSVTFDGLFDNPVNLSFSKGTVKPGERVQLRVRTQAPNTMVKVLGVDKSVKLLRSGNDITKERVLRDMMGYDYGYGCFHCDFIMFSRWWWPMPSSGSDAASIFSSADLIVLTDANLYRHQQNAYYGGPVFMAREDAAGGGLAAAPVAMDNANQAQAAPGGGMQGPERVRTEFPEKWLWDTVVTDATGQAELELTAPDTITSWVTTGFAVHETKGLSVVTKPAEVKTFLQLFVRPELPYSCIRGEIICIQATAFNYVPQPLPVLVSLAKSEEYYNVFMRPQALSFKLKEQTYHTLLRYYFGFMGPDTTRSAHFCIKPRKLGRIALNFTLMSWIPGDGVSRTLLVEPEGVPRSENTAVLADLRSPSSGNFQTDVTFTTPSNAVNGSISVRVSIAGDILGPTLNNIGGLVKMPYGCGEQNMINFAPNIYVYGYLERTNRLDDKTKAKILDYMLKGYQKELKYQHRDGSFSAFGDSSKYYANKNGSMWLTAFVSKCFVQASGLMEIEPKVVRKALMWMTSHQARNGSFIEPGQVFNKRLQGGSGSGEALTAYVLTTLTQALPWTDAFLAEDPKLKMKVEQAITNARAYLERQLPRVTDPYDLAILTYALGQSNSSQLTTARAQLETTAILADGTKHYERAETNTRPQNYWSWYDSTDALAVEATAYALCDAATQNDVTLGLGMMRWISNHRNPNGGFISTQDTVIALQCLALFAEKVYSDVFNMAVTVSWAGATKTFQVNRDTSLLLQTQELQGAAVAGTPQTVRVQASGTGLAVVDVARYYHVVEEAVDQSFQLNVTLERETTTDFLLRACTAYKLGGNSSMAVMEIGVPSGFSAELEEPGTQLPGVTRQDREDRKLILYFDEIPSEPLCVMVPMVMSSKVAKGQSNIVKVYDYYQPKDATTRLYRKTEADVCQVCPSCGGCRSRVSMYLSQSVSQSVDQLVSQSASRSVSQQASQPARRPAGQPVSQSVSQSGVAAPSDA